MRGQRIPLSVPRRIVTDLMRFAIAVPSVPVERVMDLRAVMAARAACAERPPWVAILAKAYGLLAQEFPELRRTFVKWPWPHLYEYRSSVAALTVERMYQGEPCVVLWLLKEPAAHSISEITRRIRHAMQGPIEEFEDFRRLVALARLPGVLRRPAMWLSYNFARARANYFGTYSVTAASMFGVDALHLPTWVTTLVTYGIIEPDGKVPVRVTMDHRVFDGVTIAKIMARLEAILQGPIVDELRSEATRAEAATLPSS
jgi:hypothetical protein